MSLKQEIETWVQALECYDKDQYGEALAVFSNIADTSKILFNCGVIHATLGEHDRAVDCYQRAIGLDQYLAVAYFQEGVSNFLVGDFEEALANFNDTLLYLRGNTFIDYEQLGLKFKLYSCEVLFNRGLCYIYLQQVQPGMQDFQYAVKEKMTPDHDVIDDAIREQAEGYTVFSIPVGLVYRPNEAKVKNLKQKDYLGRARLVATTDVQNVSTGFQGSEKRRQAQQDLAARDDRLPENISFAATNLVRKDLPSRTRDQSAPPTFGRQAFPPTPPPENEPKLGSMSQRSMSIKNPGAKNLPNLNLQGNSNGRTGDRPVPARNNTINTVSSDGSPEFGFGASKFPPRAGTRTPSLGVNTGVGPSPKSQQGPWSAVENAPRYGTARSASESRGQTRRPTHERSNSVKERANMVPKPLYGETTYQQNTIFEAPEPFDDVYTLYGNQDGGSRPVVNHPQYVEEEEDVIIESDSADEAHHMGRSSGSRREPRIEMRKIRIKVHANEDIRYIMVQGATLNWDDFESKIRAKFGLRGQLKFKTRDEDCGDMITMCDQDDLDTLVASAKELAIRERSEMGKMEVWVQERVQR